MPNDIQETGQAGQKYGRSDLDLALLAARQHGLVSRGQLRRLSYGPDAIRYRVRMGRLCRVHQGVYSVGHGRLTRLGRYMAAVLSCGEGAVVSHHGAASLSGVQPNAKRLMDVTVPGRGPGPRPGIAVHCRQSLHPDDVTAIEGIPATSPARTLRDLAGVVPLRRLERAFDDAERLRLLDLRALEAVEERRRGCPGSRAFAKLMAEWREPPWTRSELERHFLDLCSEVGLPAPVVNGTLLGFEVDFHWPTHQLVVEADSFEFHRTRAAFERDRRRDATLQVQGQRVLRPTKRRLAHDAASVMSEIRALLTR